uniref:uncharacterized protein LOC104266575 isoform X2 n=1 Tax=Ciona intestinalis TaxID=7719 RepID=UPI000EF4F267|nr:uncharacterized protein LOC104266575 isoform X2 [Ciona intestinalis]|eukprot:XP_026695805.1 uncharacterized protein LOC104266575 isoform X2 [Ciona intestinalis]
MKIQIKPCSSLNDVLVRSIKSEYNSIGNTSCPSGSELFFKVNGSFVVDRTTTCNAYAEWTNINNMLCSKGPNTNPIIGNYTVQAGSRAILECIYSGEVPAATYSIFYFNQTATNVTKSSTWISPPLQASDNNKVVECQAVNQYTNYFKQSHRANITLNVTYPPETRNTSIICHWAIGNPEECIVEFTSNPKADSFILKMGNVVITSGVSLTAQQHKTQKFIYRKTKVSETDFGIYQLTLTSNIFPHNAFVMNITIASLYTKAEEIDPGYVTIIIALGSITAVIIISLALVYYRKKTRTAKVTESTSAPYRIYATIAEEHRNTVTTNGITHVYETTPASLYTFAETSDKTQTSLESSNKNNKDSQDYEIPIRRASLDGRIENKDNAGYEIPIRSASTDGRIQVYIYKELCYCFVVAFYANIHINRTKITLVTKSQFEVQVLTEELRTKITLVTKSQFEVQVLIIADMRYLYKELSLTTMDMNSQFHQNRTNLAQVDIQQCIEPMKLFDYPTRRIYVLVENNHKILKNESDQISCKSL